jgi:hypothetical protein
MKLRYIAIVLTITLTSAAAQAQSGVFVTFDAQQFTQDGIYANPGTHGNVDRPWLFGAGYGGYVDVTKLPKLLFLKGGALKTGPVVIGIDGRGDTLRLSEYGSQLDRQDGLFSLRIAAKKPFMGATPYLIGGFGIGHTRIPFKANYQNNFIYEFGIGADRKISRHFDWRVEGTAGFLGSYAVGSGGAQSNYLVTVRTGPVYRFK